MKKRYRKPQIVKVKLNVEQTVLGNCKFVGVEEGPFVYGRCDTLGTPCEDQGS